jgi:hypothetical protein
VPETRLFRAETTLTFFSKDGKTEARQLVTLKDSSTTKWVNKGIRVDHNPGNGARSSARTKITFGEPITWVKPEDIKGIAVDDTANDKKTRIFISDSAEIRLIVSTHSEMVISRQSLPVDDLKMAPIADVVKGMIFLPPRKIRW